MNTSEVEKDLEFLGFIVLENRIKKETKPVIKQLQNAKVRTIMVTGDHIQTAVSVAKECKMIPSKSQVIFVTAGEESEDVFEGNQATSNALKVFSNLYHDCYLIETDPLKLNVDALRLLNLKFYTFRKT